MLSDEHAYTVCTCIASPRTDKHKPYGKHSSRKHSCKVNVKQHYHYIKYSEKCRHDLLCIIFRIRKYKHCHLADQIRHKKQHKPCMFFSREIFFHINKRIIPESKNITDNFLRLKRGSVPDYLCFEPAVRRWQNPNQIRE